VENLDVRVLRCLRDWRQAGRRALLATVVRTWGSSPRPIGSIMALADDGAVVGSVSGGCIEDDLIARYTGAVAAADTSALPAGPTGFVKYGITADEAHRFACPVAARWSCCWNVIQTLSACRHWSRRWRLAV
jgi:xanthine dehydrogenase accessory factor